MEDQEEGKQRWRLLNAPLSMEGLRKQRHAHRKHRSVWLCRQQAGASARGQGTQARAPSEADTAHGCVWAWGLDGE
jgi:hypothetical protein